MIQKECFPCILLEKISNRVKKSLNRYNQGHQAFNQAYSQGSSRASSLLLVKQSGGHMYKESYIDRLSVCSGVRVG